MPDIPTGIVAELYPVAPKDAVAPPSDGIGIYGPLDRSSVVDQMAWRSSAAEQSLRMDRGFCIHRCLVRPLLRPSSLLLLPVQQWIGK